MCCLALANLAETCGLACHRCFPRACWVEPELFLLHCPAAVLPFGQGRRWLQMVNMQWDPSSSVLTLHKLYGMFRPDITFTLVCVSFDQRSSNPHPSGQHRHSPVEVKYQDLARGCSQRQVRTPLLSSGEGNNGVCSAAPATMGISPGGWRQGTQRQTRFVEGAEANRFPPLCKGWILSNSASRGMHLPASSWLCT